LYLCTSKASKLSTNIIWGSWQALPILFEDAAALDNLERGGSGARRCSAAACQQ
jgi:hypothetical protein